MRSCPKSALHLAGGGPVGGIYEIGASVALAEAIDGLDFNHADIFVGVSSGSLVAAAFANGIYAREAGTRILIDNNAEGSLSSGNAVAPGIRRVPPSRALSIPDPAPLGAPAATSPTPSTTACVRVLPASLAGDSDRHVFDNSGIDRVMREMFTRPGRTNDFRKLKHRLFLVATDLDSGESDRLRLTGLR